MMHYCRHTTWLTILVGSDLYFLVAVSLVCDEMSRLGSLGPLQILAYMVTLALFLVRVYHYKEFMSTLVMYRRTRTDLPMPYSDLRPLWSAFWYSFLTAYLMIVAAQDDIAVDLARSTRFTVLTWAWIVASATKYMTAWRIDDRAALRLHIRKALARKERHGQMATRAIWSSSSRRHRQRGDANVVVGSAATGSMGESTTTAETRRGIHQHTPVSLLPSSNSDDDSMSDEELIDIELSERISPRSPKGKRSSPPADSSSLPPPPLPRSLFADGGDGSQRYNDITDDDSIDEEDSESEGER